MPLKRRLPLVISHAFVQVKQTFSGIVKKSEDTEPKKSRWWQDYNLSQLCYFFATAILFIEWRVSDTPESIDISTAAIFALCGLIRELLSLFNFIWSFTLGKAITLILYATTANVALAFAAMQINLITGVEPSPFVFTLGFTTVLLLPFWIVTASMLFFSVSLVIANLWLLIRLPMRLVGLRLAIHWEDKKHPLITMLMRIILIPIVMVGMFQLAAPYIAMTFEDAELRTGLFSNVVTINAEGLENGELQDLSPEDVQDIKQGIERFEESKNKFDQTNIERAKFIRSLVADFLFYFEAYPNSACEKLPEQRSVIIDENMMLMISPDETQDYGYRYEVGVCQPRLNAEPQAK